GSHANRLARTEDGAGRLSGTAAVTTDDVSGKSTMRSTGKRVSSSVGMIWFSGTLAAEGTTLAHVSIVSRAYSTAWAPFAVCTGPTTRCQPVSSMVSPTMMNPTSNRSQMFGRIWLG